jgi:RimJ/RimL family protein N-acetyltransferase
MTDRRDLFRGTLVRIVAPAEEDAVILSRWSEDSDYLRSLDTDYARPLSTQEVARRLDPEQSDSSRLEFHVRTLDKDRLIGFVALHSIEWNNGSAKLAIGIGEPNYRGKGYGTDALRLLLRYAFDELNLYRVGLEVISNNVRAIRTYEQLGFQQEGAMRGGVLRDGHRHDILLMGILRDEWMAHADEPQP